MSTHTIYIFSILSESSICMANSVEGAGHNIIFTNIPEDITELRYLIRQCNAKGYKAEHCDLLSVASDVIASDSPVVIVLLNDEDINIRNVFLLSEKYAGYKNLQIFCFASSSESEYLIDNINICNYRTHLHPMKLRRILPIRKEIYHQLYLSPPFRDAKPIHGERWINAVIIGLGQYGMEMLRGLLWFCQMDGYFLRIDVFDKSNDIKERFSALCPGIMERGFLPRMGMDYYDLHFYPAIDPVTSDLTDSLLKLPDTSLIFIDEGSDHENISLALRLRSFYAGYLMDKGIYSPHTKDAIQSPRIQAVVCDDSKAALIADNGLKNFKEQYFNIECVGRASDVYSIKRLIDDPMEKKALVLHSQTGTHETFEMYEYFRRSSIASAMHQKYRKEYIMDEDIMAVTEHKRWCAYMRSTEGYRYGTTRDDLAKRHPSLTPYANLSLSEKEKDFRLNNDK